MSEHIIIDNVNNVYECKNCGIKTEPPWMTPPPNIALDARDFFISQHNDCKPLAGV
jgi:hypothetical protein